MSPSVVILLCIVIGAVALAIVRFVKYVRQMRLAYDKEKYLYSLEAAIEDPEVLRKKAEADLDRLIELMQDNSTEGRLGRLEAAQKDIKKRLDEIERDTKEK